MAARDNDIGACRCPVCDSPSAHLRVSVKQLAYVMCNSCNSQTMARSDRSDRLLRDRLVVRDVPAESVRTDVAPAPEPARTNVAPAPPVPTPAPVPTSKPAPLKPLWGFGGRL